MPIFRFIFPITNYYGDGIFEKHVYIEAPTRQCPTKEQVRAILVREREKEMKWPEAAACDELGECLKCMDTVENWPWLSEAMYETNSFCETKWGRQPLTATRLMPYKMTEE